MPRQVQNCSKLSPCFCGVPQKKRSAPIESKSVSMARRLASWCFVRLQLDPARFWLSSRASRSTSFQKHDVLASLPQSPQLSHGPDRSYVPLLTYSYETVTLIRASALQLIASFQDPIDEPMQRPQGKIQVWAWCKTSSGIVVCGADLQIQNLRFLCGSRRSAGMNPSLHTLFGTVQRVQFLLELSIPACTGYHFSKISQKKCSGCQPCLQPPQVEPALLQHDLILPASHHFTPCIVFDPKSAHHA